jgi:VIT1/CCC1 family predicted Fe2+/Mn2+ transporter
MWPTNDIWANALIFAATGSALIFVAFLGSVLGTFEEGRRVMKAASIGLGILIVLYIAAAMYVPWSSPDKECIYAPAHPSDC